MRRSGGRFQGILSAAMVMFVVGGESIAAPDRTPPTVHITSSNTFIVGTINVTGTATDNTSVKKVEVSVEGVSPYAMATSGSSAGWSSWSFTTQLNNPGTYRILAALPTEQEMSPRPMSRSR